MGTGTAENGRQRLPTWCSKPQGRDVPASVLYEVFAPTLENYLTCLGVAPEHLGDELHAIFERVLASQPRGYPAGQGSPKTWMMGQVHDHFLQHPPR